MIQLSLDNVPKLISPISEADCHIVLDNFSPYYVQEGLKAQEVFEPLRRITFALLSVNAPFDATCKAYTALKDVDLLDFWTVLNTIRQARGNDGVVSYAYTKAKWLHTLAFNAKVEGISYNPGKEGDAEYREYLRTNVKGLAWAKSSFAVMLVKGTADVACIDTHMHRLFTGNVAKTGIGKRKYLELENKVRSLALTHGIPTSVAQHCLWDSMRGIRSKLVPV